MSSTAPLTEAEMQRRIEQANHTLTSQHLQEALDNQYLRADVRDLIEKARAIHNLNTP